MWKDKAHPLLAGGKGEYGGNKNKTFDITEELDKNGYWSLIPNEKGWVLMSKDRMGMPYIVKDSQGKNIEMMMQDIMSKKTVQEVTKTRQTQKTNDNWKNSKFELMPMPY